MKAVRIHRTGGPEVLQVDDVELSPPGPDQVRVRHTVIGVNFIDIYHRNGLYPLPMPAIIPVRKPRQRSWTRLGPMSAP